MQSIEAWQNEKHYLKENNTSENPIPRREIYKSVLLVKYEGQVTKGDVEFDVKNRNSSIVFFVYEV